LCTRRSKRWTPVRGELSCDASRGWNASPRCGRSLLWFSSAVSVRCGSARSCVLFLVRKLRAREYQKPLNGARTTSRDRVRGSGSVGRFSSLSLALPSAAAQADRSGSTGRISPRTWNSCCCATSSRSWLAVVSPASPNSRRRSRPGRRRRGAGPDGGAVTTRHRTCSRISRHGVGRVGGRVRVRDASTAGRLLRVPAAVKRARSTARRGG
jgi:hypothetical protein